MTPARFNNLLDTRTFASKKTDPKLVKELYAAVFNAAAQICEDLDFEGSTTGQWSVAELTAGRRLASLPTVATLSFGREKMHADDICAELIRVVAVSAPSIMRSLIVRTGSCSQQAKHYMPCRWITRA